MPTRRFWRQPSPALAPTERAGVRALARVTEPVVPVNTGIQKTIAPGSPASAHHRGLRGNDEIRALRGPQRNLAHDHGLRNAARAVHYGED